MEGLNLFESDILFWIQENLRIDALDHFMPLVSAVNNAGLLSILTVAVLLFLCSRDGAVSNWCGVLALAAACLIAFSRLYNAAHYPMDVLAGMLIGGVTAVVAYQCVYMRWRKRRLGD